MTAYAHRHRGVIGPQPQLYPYAPSATGRYRVSREQAGCTVQGTSSVHVLVFEGTEQECWAYLHARCAYSLEHALRYEGWIMKAIEEITS